MANPIEGTILFLANDNFIVIDKLVSVQTFDEHISKFFRKDTVKYKLNIDYIDIYRGANVFTETYNTDAERRTTIQSIKEQLKVNPSLDPAVVKALEDLLTGN